MHPRHVLVIGGGFAGVAAAASLRARNVTVTVLDDRASLGGRARSDAFAGMSIDTGAQFIASSFTRTLRLLARGDRAVSADEVERTGGAHGGRIPPGLHVTPGRDMLLRDGTEYTLHYGSVRSLLAFGGLGAVEKMKLGAYLLPMLTRHRAELDAGATRQPAALDREHARTVVAARISERAADLLVEPPLNSFYAMRGSDASLAFFLTLARYGSESQLLAANAGWSVVLANALHGSAHIPEVRIHAIELPAAGGVIARTEDGREWRGDGAVIATGPHTARTLLSPHIATDHPLRHWLGATELRPSWTLALALDTPLDRGDVFGVFQDVRRSQTVSACAIYDTKVHEAAPRDGGVVLAWPTPETARTLAGEPGERIITAMMPEIETLLPEVRGHVTRARLYRFEEGTPIARPGFAADRARGRALVEQLALPIALAGDYLTTPLIEGAVISGERAAAVVAQRLAL
jgi:predicted NAD/FAD-dependent oxidoreductase